MLKGVIQADETFVGGKFGNKNKSKRNTGEENRGGNKGKTIVAGLLQEDGKVVSRMVENTSINTLNNFMVKHVVQGSTIVTD